jgi:hypothetical protein
MRTFWPWCQMSTKFDGEGVGAYMLLLVVLRATGGNAVECTVLQVSTSRSTY